MIACDGSDLNISLNPQDEETYFQSQPTDRGYNQMHLNALFDLCNKRYVDADIQPARKENEIMSMTKMVDRYSGEQRTIFIADRGYESYNTFAHIQEKGMYYLIRVKDGIVGGITRSLELPKTAEFDYKFKLALTNRISEQRENDIFYRLYKKNTFDYLSPEIRAYSMDLRIVRFAISENSYEMIMDRGYDDNKMFLKMDELGQDYVIRLKSNRKLLYHNKWTMATKLRNRRKGKVKMNVFYKGKDHEAYLSHVKVQINASRKDIYLVLVYGITEHPMMLATNKEIKSKEDVIKVARIYFSRWKIEEYFRCKNR